MDKLLRGTRFIAFFLILYSYPGALIAAVERELLPVLFLECFIYLGLTLAAIGIFFRKGWGRLLAVVCLLLNFFYISYVLLDLIGPASSAITDYLEISLAMSPDVILGGMIAVAVVSMLWPMVFIGFLMHPRVKGLFASRSLPGANDEEVMA